MFARSLGIAVVGCAGPTDELPRPADSPAVERGGASGSASAAPPATSATASAEVDVSYPDKTIPAPSGSTAGRPALTHVLGRVGVERVIQNYAKQAGSLRTGDKEGIVLRRLRPDEALAELGLENGDVVRDINGFDLRDPDQAVDAYAKLRREARLEIRAFRDGKPMTIIIEQK